MKQDPSHPFPPTIKPTRPAPPPLYSISHPSHPSHKHQTITNKQNMGCTFSKLILHLNLPASPRSRPNARPASRSPVRPSPPRHPHGRENYSMWHHNNELLQMLTVLNGRQFLIYDLQL